MNKKYTVVIAIAAVLYVVYHIATLVYSPLPWFDEVSFTSITESYMKNHTFYETPRIYILPDEKLNYGPIYFVLQAYLMKLLGFTIFNFRITNMLFGFFDLFLIYKVCQKFRFSTAAIIATLLFTGLEPNYGQFLHSGRMDFIMLFFMLNAYLVFLEAKTKSGATLIAYSVLTGLLLSCAFLTNPRIVFTFFTFIAYFVYEMMDLKDKERKDAFVKYLVIAGAFVGLYLVWIFRAYGSIQGYIYNNFQNSRVMNEHIGVTSSRFMFKYNLLIYAYSLIAFLLLVKNKLVKQNIDLVLLCLPGIVAFLLIVTGGINGRYYTLVGPFTAMLIVGATTQLLNNKLLRSLTYAMVGIFGFIFVFKSLFILSSIRQHDPVENEKVISQYITPNSTICGDFNYYYIARHNNCNFISITENIFAEKLIDSFNFRYYVLAKNDKRNAYFEKFLLKKYRLKATIKNREDASVFSRIINKLPYRISEGYACSIYELADSAR